MRRILMLLLALLVAGCALPKADPAREAAADHIYKLARHGDVASLAAMASPAVRDELPTAMPQLQAQLYTSEPTSARTLGWTLNRVNADAAYRVARLYRHPEGEVQAVVTMVRTGDAPWQVNGLHVMRVSAAERAAYDASVEAARFTLSDKSPVHYLMLMGAALSATLSMLTAVVAGARRRWGWMIGVLFGVCQLTINWTTGALFLQPIYVSLLAAGILKGLGAADPWFLSVAVPLPAILFWALGKWRPKPPKQKRPPKEAEGTPEA